jgi:hypothetical protein
LRGPALIEVAYAHRSQQAQRVGQIGLREPIAFDERLPAGREYLGHRRVRQQRRRHLAKVQRQRA